MRSRLRIPAKASPFGALRAFGPAPRHRGGVAARRAGAASRRGRRRAHESGWPRLTIVAGLDAQRQHRCRRPTCAVVSVALVAAAAASPSEFNTPLRRRARRRRWSATAGASVGSWRACAGQRAARRRAVTEGGLSTGGRALINGAWSIYPVGTTAQARTATRCFRLPPGYRAREPRSDRKPAPLADVDAPLRGRDAARSLVTPALKQAKLAAGRAGAGADCLRCASARSRPLPPRAGTDLRRAPLLVDAAAARHAWFLNSVLRLLAATQRRSGGRGRGSRLLRRVAIALCWRRCAPPPAARPHRARRTARTWLLARQQQAPCRSRRPMAPDCRSALSSWRQAPAGRGD